MKCSIIYSIRQENAEVVCTQPALCRWAGGFHLVPEGLTKALFSRPYNQTSHVSGERGEPCAVYNDQHIPGLSGIPAVKSLAVCTDPPPRNTWKPFVWGWGSEQHHYDKVLHVLHLKHCPLVHPTTCQLWKASSWASLLPVVTLSHLKCERHQNASQETTTNSREISCSPS